MRVLGWPQRKIVKLEAVMGGKQKATATESEKETLVAVMMIRGGRMWLWLLVVGCRSGSGGWWVEEVVEVVVVVEVIVVW